jgi:hypothetical protein
MSSNKSICFKIEKLEERIAPCRVSPSPNCNNGNHGPQGNNGFGNGGNDGVPGNSGKQDCTR